MKHHHHQSICATDAAARAAFLPVLARTHWNYGHGPHSDPGTGLLGQTESMELSELQSFICSYLNGSKIEHEDHTKSKGRNSDNSVLPNGAVA